MKGKPLHMAKGYWAVTGHSYQIQCTHDHGNAFVFEGSVAEALSEIVGLSDGVVFAFNDPKQAMLFKLSLA